MRTSCLANFRCIAVFFIYLSSSHSLTPDFHQILQNSSSLYVLGFLLSLHILHEEIHDENVTFADWHSHFYSYIKHRFSSQLIFSCFVYAYLFFDKGILPRGFTKSFKICLRSRGASCVSGRKPLD